MNFRYLLILFVIPGLSACTQPAADEAASAAAPMRVSVAEAKQHKIAPTLRLTGSLVAREDIAVGTALVGQKILSVSADVGQRVKKGQVLARLESVGVQSQLRQNEMSLAKAQAALKARQAEWREAQMSLQRYRPLAQAGAVSPQELDQQRMQADTAHENVKAAQAEIAQIQALLADSRNQRAKADIVAPADGVISQRNAEAGALAGNDALFHIIQNGELELAAQAGADDLALLQPELAAEVMVRGADKPLTGKIRVVPPEMDAQTRLGNVRITLNAADSRSLHVGAFGEAVIRLPEKTAAVSLPVQAVSFDSAGKAFVLSVDAAGKVKRQAVSIGRQQDGRVEILSDLRQGEKVVRNAAAFVNDGDVVVPVAAEE